MVYLILCKRRADFCQQSLLLPLLPPSPHHYSPYHL
jgi:hypothetical protein